MEERFERGVRWTSVICLVAAALVIPLGFLGFAASPGIVVALLALAGGTVYADQYGGIDRDELRWLWLGPLLGAAVVAVGVTMDASPGELQSLGGIVGLVGVFNLLLRPVYHLLLYVLTRTIRLGREQQDDSR